MVVLAFDPLPSTFPFPLYPHVLGLRPSLARFAAPLIAPLA